MMANMLPSFLARFYRYLKAMKVDDGNDDICLESAKFIYKK